MRFLEVKCQKKKKNIDILRNDLTGNEDEIYNKVINNEVLILKDISFLSPKKNYSQTSKNTAKKNIFGLFNKIEIKKIKLNPSAESININHLKAINNNNDDNEHKNKTLNKDNDLDKKIDNNKDNDNNNINGDDSSNRDINSIRKKLLKELPKINTRYHLNESTIARNIKKLEDKGFIERIPDKRKKIIKITKKGKYTAEKVMDYDEKWDLEIKKNLTNEEYQTFIRLLKKICEDLI